MAASYKQAISWIVLNDDTSDIEQTGIGTVTMALVADIFGKDDEKVMADIKRAKEKFENEK